MSPVKVLAVLLAAVMAVAQPARASEPLTALARPDVTASSVSDFGGNVLVTLALSQPVLWRLYTLDAPMRLVLEFGEVDWAGTQPEQMLDSDAVGTIRAETGRPGWSRLVLDLEQPLKVETAGMSTTTADGGAVLKIQLAPTEAKSFAETVASPHGFGFTLPEAPRRGDAGAESGPLVVVIDPGHGGIDP